MTASPRPHAAPATTAEPLNIGQAAAATGLTMKMVRHYEAAGLLPAVHRTPAGYRQFTPQDVERLRFIGRARSMGFSLAEIDSLLALWDDRSRRSSDVKALTQGHIAALDEKIRTLQAMRETLQTLANACDGNERPDCPILQGLGSASR